MTDERHILAKDTLIPIGSVIIVLASIASFSYKQGVMTNQLENLAAAVETQSADIKALTAAVNRLTGASNVSYAR